MPSDNLPQITPGTLQELVQENRRLRARLELAEFALRAYGDRLAILERRAGRQPPAEPLPEARLYRGKNALPLDFEHACSVVERYFSLTRGALRSRLRGEAVVLARHLLMYLLHTEARWSFPRIGKAFGMDHSSVIHACQRVQAKLSSPAEQESTVQHLANLLRRIMQPERSAAVESPA